LTSWQGAARPPRLAGGRRGGGPRGGGAGGGRGGGAGGPRLRPCRGRAHAASGWSSCRWLPPNSDAVRPTSTSALPTLVKAGPISAAASGTWATAVITNVGGTAWRRPSAPRYSLFSESLPLTNGAAWATDASQQPRTAATSSPSVAGR